MKKVIAALVAAGLAAPIARRARRLSTVEPSLRANPLLWVSVPVHRPTVLKVIRSTGIRGGGSRRATERLIPGPAGPRRALIHRPTEAAPGAPAILWIHGGGMVFGDPGQDSAKCASWAQELGAVVVAPSYRFAPEDPHPAAPEDCYAAWTWLVDHADELGVDPERMVIAGASAGGGLAAIVSHLIKDRGATAPILQMLVYPMLDDRTNERTDHDGRGEFVWTPAANRFGWDSFIGDADRATVAPARRADLAGLPPAWIGVGDLDLFHDEDVEYARRLQEAGVPVELVVVPGAYHGFDLMAGSSVVEAFALSQAKALARAFEAGDDQPATSP